MRHAKRNKTSAGVTALGFKSVALTALILGLTPLQAQAAESCNAAINIYGVDGPSTFFEGDTLTLKATIGAGQIRDSALTGEGVDDNPYIDFTGLGYGLDCGGDSIMDSLSDCRPVGGGEVGTLSGHQIEFLGVTDTDCVTADGDPAQWPPFESNNIVAVPVLNGVIRQHYRPALGEGDKCNVDVSFVVRNLHESTNWVTQALGVPFNNETPDDTSDDMLGSCSNGLGAGDYAKASFQVQSCGILVTKEVSLDGEVWVDAATAVSGQDVYYRVLVENTGTAPLVGNAVVNDALLSVENQTVDVDGLNPGEVLIIDGGKIANFDTKASCEVETTVTNTAGVEAWCRGSDGSELEISSFMEDTAALTCTPPPPSIDLVKTADPLVYDTVGETITYSFTVTNDGNVALGNVGVVDPLPRLGTISCPKTELAVAEQMVCTATYVIDQADLNATFVNNTATATGTSPSGQTVQDTDSANISTTPRYSLGLVKTADPQYYESDGEDIGYSYELTNAGNQTLYPPYAVSDDKTSVQCPGIPAMLNPGDSVTCSATYTTTVADVANRSVTNVAQGSAQNAPAEGATVLSNEDEETVVYRGIELSAAGICVNDVPWVEYSFDVYGFPGYQPSDVTYTWVNVDDPDNPVIVKGPLAFTATSGHLLWPEALATGPAGPGSPADGTIDPSWPDGVAWPGWTEDPAGVWTFTDTVAVPQLELRAQINPGDVVVVNYPQATPNCAPPAVITVDKTVLSVTPVGTGSVDVGYKVSVSNTGGKAGTYDLYDVLMADEAFTAASIQAPVTYAAGTENDQSGTITAGLTADDFNNGATIVSDEDLEAGLDEGFTFTLRFAIDELLVTAEGANCDKDDDEGGRTGLTNHVDVLVDGQVVDEAEACGELPLTPSILVLKEIRDGEAWLPADTPGTAPVRYYPASAEYRIVVKNTGPVDLQNVVVSDAKVGLVDYPVNGGFLAAWQEVTIGVGTEPGETDGLLVAEACDASGDFPNTAEVAGEGVIEGTAVSDSDMAYLACVGKPGVTVVKEVSTDGGTTFHDANLIEVEGEMVISDPAGPIEVGDGAIYRITVTNSGQVDLVDIEVSDSMIPNGPFEIALLPEGEFVVIDEGDWIDLNVASVCGSAGTYKNIATAVGTSDEMEGDTDIDTDDANVVCIGDPSIEIVKEVSIDDGVNWTALDVPPYPTAVVDDTAETALYRITVRNPDEKVTLVNVHVLDEDLGIDYLVGVLGPLEEVVLVAAGYAEEGQIELTELTVPDICGTRGEKVNIAVATGESQAGAPAEDQDSATVDCVDEPKILLVKLVSADGVNFSPDLAVGLVPSDAYYRFEVTNTGNVALENVTVSDEELLGPGVTIPVGTLAVGETKVIAHDASQDVEWPTLAVPGFCAVEGEYPNIATASGDSVESAETATDTDTALYQCNVPEIICSMETGGTKPNVLYMMYDGTVEGINHQGDAPIIVTEVEPLPDPATIRSYHKGTLFLDEVVAVGGQFDIGGWHNDGRIAPNVYIEIWNEDATVLHQKITFHGSCSAPLVVGDSFGGVTIIGYKRN